MPNSNMKLWAKNEGHFYVKNSKSAIGEGWTYYLDDCFARVHVRDGKCFIASQIDHNHFVNEVKTILRSVENRLKPRAVFDDVMKR